ncbi:hypothetical protein ACGGKE_14720 [Sphingobium naphthae]|uniref:argonaute/piwi family protein n=1 Tax=Sphingobium naphthae TaxID=1886786 RepID=UPI0037486ACC
MTSEIGPAIWFPEADLVFHPDRTADRDIHPLRGLARFGPYSNAFFTSNPIQIATIAPHKESEPLFGFMRELDQSFKPRERSDYLPDWPGFATVFGTRKTAAAKRCRVELEPDLDALLRDAEMPHLLLADRLVRAIQQIEAFRTDFDVLYIYLPQRWQPGFKGAADDFDLHDHLKAYTAARGIPLQIVREDKAIAYSCRASVMWRLGLALYAKAGGVPWKLADVDPETAYIGISYSVRPVESDRPRFVTCCSQVFDADGSGLEFVAYDTNDVEVQRENPFLSRREMFRVITRSMQLYRRRHGGVSPRRVMIHKSTEFKEEEALGCFDALPTCEAIDLVQVVEDVGWRGVRWERDRKDPEKQVADGFPIKRGTLIGIGEREALLWVHGAVVLNNRTYFQGSRSTPQPIRLVRHAGHGSWDDTARSVLALSKMNWNNDGLYDPLPVTMGYAKVLSRVLKRMNGLGSSAYHFRYFM